ncbi:MAG: aminotransferase class I/II-fold pyridoxal phosphate-dependent enzyme [Planctomycetia bacterium]|nr:aminotransferase class I/II-fold pyridoxal phosphate-dependent enzyme [Planctomycetia bacterium]
MNFDNKKRSTDNYPGQIAPPENKWKEKIPAFDELFRFDGPPDATVTVGGHDFLYFGGDGYLGLQANPEVLAATCEAVLQHGVSSATSRRHYTSSPVWEVEKLAARMFNTQNAFYCSSEDKLFEVLLESLDQTFEQVFIDEACNPFIFRTIEKLLGNRCPVHAFRHQDTKQLTQLLREQLEPGDRPLLVTEGVFPALGTTAPLDKYSKILSRYDDSSMLVEDSHGFGVLGRCGLGTLEHFKFDMTKINQTRNDLYQEDTFSPDLDFTPEAFLDGTAPVLPQSPRHSAKDRQGNSPALPVRVYWMTSLSKAIGGFGGMLPGSNLFVERLTELATRSGVGVPPSPLAAATAKSLELSFTDSSIRKKLIRNTKYFKRGLKQLGFLITESPVPVIPIRLGSSQNMRRIQQLLSRRQILISYMPRQKNLGSQGALRITIFSTHSKRMLDSFLKELAETIAK